MDKLDRIIANLEAFNQEEFERVLLEILKKHEHTIIDLNLSQLLNGKDSNGESLGEYSSILYAEFKKRLNPKGVVDLRLEGDFYRGFFADTSKFPIDIDSNDSKRDSLVDQYGTQIFGLDKASLGILSEEILPELIAYIKSLVDI